MRPIRLLAGGLLRLLDGAVLAAFALGFAARYLRPTGLTWPVQLFAIGLPYVALAVVVVTLLRLRTFSARARLLHAAALALAAVRFVPAVRTAAPEAEGDLRVLTYNVPMRWGGFDEVGKGEILKNRVELAAPDVAAFQDVNVWRSGGRDLIERHVKPVADELGYAWTPVPPGLGGYLDVPVLFQTRPDTVAYAHLWKDRAQEYPTGLTRAQFRWAGRPAALYNVHLRSYGMRKPWRDPNFHLNRPTTWASYLRQYRDAYLYRAWEVDTLRALLDRERLPYLVTGDLNSTPHHWATWALARGLTDAQEAAGRGWGATYHSALPVVRIDYVLASPAWTVVGAEAEDWGLSDHRAVLARLRWRE